MFPTLLNMPNIFWSNLGKCESNSGDQLLNLNHFWQFFKFKLNSGFSKRIRSKELISRWINLPRVLKFCSDSKN